MSLDIGQTLDYARGAAGGKFSIGGWPDLDAAQGQAGHLASRQLQW